RAVRAPDQEMVDRGWLVIFIHAQEGDVQVITRIGKVVRITPKKGCVVLWRKDEPNIGVFFIFVKIVHASLIEGHHIAAGLGGIGAFLFESGHSPALCRKSLSWVYLRLGGPVDLGRDIFNGG